MTDSPGADRVQGPHQTVQVSDPREYFTLMLLDYLWQRYRRRVPYAAIYEQLIAREGAQFVNDHIAFRTLACQQPRVGIASIARLFEALGYRPAGCYSFEDKHLNALHYQHPMPGFPKLFISELKVWELSRGAREIITRTLKNHRPPIPEGLLAELTSLRDAEPESWDDLLQTVVQQFQDLPWEPPLREDLLALNGESQYAAWVLVHGYEVNHFTALVNSHGVVGLDDIEKTADALRQAGVPMKATIEGERSSKLRQTATEAVTVEVPISDRGVSTRIHWTYAYFELAQRGEVTDPETGQRTQFQGFLGPQAAQLFEMTRVQRG